MRTCSATASPSPGWPGIRRGSSVLCWVGWPSKTPWRKPALDSMKRRRQMSDTAVPNEEFLADLEEAMRDVVDPELGINVVDLGLVYGVNVEEDDTGKVALIDMTLTSAACPLTDVIEDQSRTALVGAGLVNEIKINWVWNPPWGPDKI